MLKEKTVTIQDLARAANVSTASVSRVLNKSDKVSTKVRQRVLQAVDSMNYIPNSAARALASQSTMTIGAVVPTLENPGFAIGVEALQKKLAEKDYTLFVASSNYDLGQEKRQVEKLVTRGVDGIMLVGSLHGNGLIDYLRRRNVPFVETWVLSTNAGVSAVGFNNREASTRITDYLLNLGHVHFGVIGGVTKTNDRARERIKGIKQTLNKRGLKLGRESLLERPFSIVDGQLAMRSLLAVRPRPTAVICGNDILAFGALLECQKQAIAVPENVSVVGFDDLDFAASLIPSLTTIRVPADEIGSAAAETLLAEIAGKTDHANTKLDVDLIVRKSTGPPP